MEAIREGFAIKMTDKPHTERHIEDLGKLDI